MMARPLSTILMALRSAIAVAAVTVPAYRLNSIVMLQPIWLVEQRVDVKQLSAHIERLEVAATEFATANPDKSARNGFIVFATRPDRSTKVWLDLQPVLPPEQARALIAKLESAKPAKVKDGTVVVALNVSLWDATTPSQTVSMPSPPEWRAFVTDKEIEVTEPVDALWPIEKESR